jgi:flagellar basal-body rod protein FlgC
MSGSNDLFSGMRISSSALSAERTRIDVISKNIANAESTSMPDGSGPYRRQVVSFTPILERALDGSTSVAGMRVGAITPDTTTPFPVLHDPSHRDHDAQGNVLMPNVNVVSEMADLILAMRSYEANLNSQDNFVKMAERALRVAQ